MLMLATSTGLQAWTERRDFNGGTLGEKVDLHAQGRTVYDNTHVLEGDMSAKLTAIEGETGYGNWGGYIAYPTPLQKGDEIWFRVNVYFPTGFDYRSYGEGNRLKFLRFDTLSASGSNQGYNDIYIDKIDSSVPFKYIKEAGLVGWRNIGDLSQLPKFDRWEAYEFYVYFDNIPKAQGGHAIVRFWKNGRLLREITDVNTLNEANSISTRALLFTYWNGGSPKTQSMWVDSIVLTSDTPDRKDELGNHYIGMPAINQRPLSPERIIIINPAPK